MKAGALIHRNRKLLLLGAVVVSLGILGLMVSNQTERVGRDNSNVPDARHGSRKPSSKNNDTHLSTGRDVAFRQLDALLATREDLPESAYSLIAATFDADGDGLGLFQILLREDPVVAFAVARRFSGIRKETLTQMALRSLADADPRRAVEAVSGLGPGVSRSAGICAIAGRFVASQIKESASFFKSLLPEEQTKYLENLPDSLTTSQLDAVMGGFFDDGALVSEPNGVAIALLKARIDAKSIDGDKANVAHIQQLISGYPLNSVPARAAYAHALIWSYKEQNPGELLTFAANSPDEAICKNTAILAAQLVGRDTDRALSVIRELNSGASKIEAAKAAYGELVTADSVDASTRLSREGDSEVKDGGILALVEYLKQMGDNEAAYKWARVISDSRLRGIALENMKTK